jgi:two-component system chemotaxis response regulator CheB
MGNDGLRGCEAIRRTGGRVLAESAESCVVYGMPRSVIEAGFASAEAPLDQIPNLLVDQIFESHMKERKR